MLITNLKVTGYRSLFDVDIDFDPLTVLIGENDSGKSSVLDLLDICLRGTQPVEKDFYVNAADQKVDKIEAILTFGNVPASEAEPLVHNGHLTLKKVFFQNQESQTHYLGKVPQDDRLQIDFPALPAPDQKNLIRELDPAVADADLANAETRAAWISNYTQAAPKKESWIQFPRTSISELPRFERYTAMDYSTPENVIGKTLAQVFDQTIHQNVETDAGVSKQLIAPLRDLENEARKNIQTKLTELEESIIRYNPAIKRIGYEPTFNFGKGLGSGEFLVDQGFGLRSLSRVGDGTKRRMFMAITDWDREVTLAQARSGGTLPWVIRGYDEPDTNLHYEAQRSMYSSISSIVTADNSHTQAIVCTHSLTMIDRAAPRSIRLFKLDPNGHTVVESLASDDDPEVERFLQGLASELGITNSIMFYERCFIIVEGDTEEHALPTLYRRLYGRGMIEDCIRIINVQKNSAVREILKLFAKNRADLVLVLVDSDSKGNKSANLTEASLRHAGFSDYFIQNKIRYIGTKEFEYAFPNDEIVKALEARWPKAEGAPWQADEIVQLRKGDGKFSDALRKVVWEKCPDCPGMNWTKPIYGRALADSCDLGNIPAEIQTLFTLAREIVGI
jgi:putative ATP-dependent endonuclease of OLD family